MEFIRANKDVAHSAFQQPSWLVCFQRTASTIIQNRFGVQLVLDVKINGRMRQAPKHLHLNGHVADLRSSGLQFWSCCSRHKNQYFTDVMELKGNRFPSGTT